VFEKYEAGSGGRYELHSKGANTLSGSVDVRWCKMRVSCG